MHIEHPSSLRQTLSHTLPFIGMHLKPKLSLPTSLLPGPLAYFPLLTLTLVSNRIASWVDIKYNLKETESLNPLERAINAYVTSSNDLTDSRGQMRLTIRYSTLHTPHYTLHTWRSAFGSCFSWSNQLSFFLLLPPQSPTIPSYFKHTHTRRQWTC